LKVVATVAPIADLVRQVAGGRAEVIQLIPDGTDSHSYEPRPSDARLLQQADLIVLNGLHLETPTQRLADANKPPTTPYLFLGESTIGEADWIFDFSFPAVAGDPNPHLWLDPTYARRYAELIAAQLAQLDPDNAGLYQANLASLAARLDQLDRAIFASVATVPEQNRKLLTYHDSWAYFGRRYGLEVIGAIQPSDFSEPSPREVAALIDQVRLYQLPAIFGSEVFPSRVLELIGRETGARYVDSLRDDDLPGPPGAPQHTYLGMMLDNMRVMLGSLGGRTEMFDAIDSSPVRPPARD
ncbi:MAG: metal ABC transporter substrate-binding protein, partial [Chloroflexota bacterium]|nr:metal ABC transporter substrate-binding protein [Chloroflexota bacterium]